MSGSDSRRPRRFRVYRWSSWILVGLFSFLAVVHVGLTVAFYTGLHDTGHGFFLSFEWPAWLITIIDGAAAAALWFGTLRDGPRSAWATAGAVGAVVLMIGRAAWMVLVPVLGAIVVVGLVETSRGKWSANREAVA